MKEKKVHNAVWNVIHVHYGDIRKPEIMQQIMDLLKARDEYR